MDKRWLFLTLPIMVVAGLALVKSIALLRAALPVDELAAVPLASGGEVDIGQAGELVLSVRGTLGSRDFAKASFILRDGLGRPVPSNALAMRALNTSLDGTATLSVQRYPIATPGRYRIEVSGIEMGQIADNSRLVLSKPGGTAMTLGVLSVVAAAVVLLASLVCSLLVAFWSPAHIALSLPALLDSGRAIVLVGNDSRPSAW